MIIFLHNASSAVSNETPYDGVAITGDVWSEIDAQVPMSATRLVFLYASPSGIIKKETDGEPFAYSQVRT